MPEDMSDRMPEDMSEYMPEDMPDRMPNRMPEDMSDRMPQDLPVRKCINVMVGITRSKVIVILVCGLGMNFMTLNVLGIIIPTDFHSIIFQRGRYTTNQINVIN